MIDFYGEMEDINKAMHIFNTMNLENRHNICTMSVMMNAYCNNEMNKECCESIMEDILNITNKNVMIEFRWISDKTDIYLEYVKTAFQEAAAKSKRIILQIIVDQTRNSISILPSIKHEFESQTVKHKPHANVDYSINRIVHLMIHGFVRELERENKFWCLVPDAIITLCCMFFSPEGVDMDMMVRYNTT
eukprot:489080_1